jgi:hypothetical protein
MVHIRIRVGERVHEFTRPLEECGDLQAIESCVWALLDKEFHLAGYDTVYLGKRSWDITVDGQKIGHAKSWEVTTEPKIPYGPTLFQWFLLVMGMYLALC